MHAQVSIFDRLAIIKCRLREGLLIFLLCLMGVVFDGVVWLGLAMIWARLVGVASVLELVFKRLEPMQVCRQW